MKQTPVPLMHKHGAIVRAEADGTAHVMIARGSKVHLFFHFTSLRGAQLNLIFVKITKLIEREAFFKLLIVIT